MPDIKDEDKYIRVSLKIALRLKKEPDADLDALIEEEAIRNSLDKYRLARYFAQNQQVWIGSQSYRDK